MAGIYRQRHPERTVFYRVLFHYFDEFVAEYENRFEREYGYLRPVIKEVVELSHPPIIEEEERFVPSKGWAEMIRKVFEVDPLLCPACGGQMSIISFIEDHKVIDKIIDHLKLTFMAERPPPPQRVQQELLMAAEEREEYF